MDALKNPVNAKDNPLFLAKLAEDVYLTPLHLWMI
jgi:hypothetical protein